MPSALISSFLAYHHLVWVSSLLDGDAMGGRRSVPLLSEFSLSNTVPGPKGDISTFEIQSPEDALGAGALVVLGWFTDALF